MELESANPFYAHIRYPDGRQSTVSTKDLARSPKDPGARESSHLPAADNVMASEEGLHLIPGETFSDKKLQPPNVEETVDSRSPDNVTSPEPQGEPLRRSIRVSKPPVRFGY